MILGYTWFVGGRQVSNSMGTERQPCACRLRSNGWSPFARHHRPPNKPGHRGTGFSGMVWQLGRPPIAFVPGPIPTHSPP